MSNIVINRKQALALELKLNLSPHRWNDLGNILYNWSICNYTNTIYKVTETQMEWIKNNIDHNINTEPHEFILSTVECLY